MFLNNFLGGRYFCGFLGKVFSSKKQTNCSGVVRVFAAREGGLVAVLKSKGIAWVFPKIVVPQIIHFNRVFHYKPSILGYPYFWKRPYGVIDYPLLMAEILHHQGWWLSHYLYGFIHPRWCRISSINSRKLFFWWNTGFLKQGGRWFDHFMNLVLSKYIEGPCLQRSWHDCSNFTTFTTRFGQEKPFRKIPCCISPMCFFSAIKTTVFLKRNFDLLKGVRSSQISFCSQMYDWKILKVADVTLRETNSSHLWGGHPKRKLHRLPTIHFQLRTVIFREGMHLLTNKCQAHRS